MIQRVAAWVHYSAVCALAGWGLFLVTAPWHSSADDAHHGMMGIAPGILLILLGLLTLGVGLLMRHRSDANTIGVAGISVLVLATLIFLALR
jgi:hypothetical protein